MFQSLTADEYRTFTDTLSRAAHKARRLRNFIDESFAVTVETNRLWDDAAKLSQECSEALHWVCFEEVKRYNDEAYLNSVMRMAAVATASRCSNCLDPDHGVHAIDCPRNPRFDG